MNESNQKTPPWHSLALEEVLERLNTSEQGLDQQEADRRRKETGSNELISEDSVSPLQILASQFQNFLIYLLLLAAGLSLLTGLLPDSEPNYTDAILIVLILVANGLFGFVQDYKAQKSIAALKRLSTPETTVLRKGRKHSVDARSLVPGDVVLLEQGDVIPADSRLLEGETVFTSEAALTGESQKVAKDPSVVDEKTAIGDRSNMLFMNTHVVGGRSRAVVVATGMETEVGSIARQIVEAEDRKSPFQEEVDRLGHRIGYGVIVLILIISFVQYLFTSAGPTTILLVGVSLAVAAVPEGLPAVVTLTLAIGTRRMLKKNALVRRLAVVESLGSVDVIVTDKTGTLTENKMTVRRIYSSMQSYKVSDDTFRPQDVDSEEDGKRIEASETNGILPVLECGKICNNAEKSDEEEDEFFGDPTEIALLVSASRVDKIPSQERIRSISFSSERKRMTVVTDKKIAYTKGAPEVVIPRCDRILIEGKPEELTKELKDQILAENDRLAQNAYRVLAFARKDVENPEADEEKIEQNMIFLGLQALIDPPRDEVHQAVEDCRRAGIRVIMVTGDNLETAKAIGAETGFNTEEALEGNQLESMDLAELQSRAEKTEIFGRAAPEHKVKLLKALQENGHRVAMTGDGVNDAPALKNADVGIAMGERGTDIAQQASDMILRDDNFVTIRDAIAEGRGIFDNIRKFVNFLLSANVSEVLIVLIGILIGISLFPQFFESQERALILTPVMLLWINLVTDGFPAVALGADPKVPGILKRKPRQQDEPVIDFRILSSIALIGVLMTVAGLGLFFYSLTAQGDLIRAQSSLFTFMVLVEMVIIQVIRSRYRQSLLSNYWLIFAVLLTLLLQLAVIYTPLHTFFQVSQILPSEWLWIAIAFAVFLLSSLGIQPLEKKLESWRV